MGISIGCSRAYDAHTSQASRMPCVEMRILLIGWSDFLLGGRQKVRAFE